MSPEEQQRLISALRAYKALVVEGSAILWDAGHQGDHVDCKLCYLSRVLAQGADDRAPAAPPERRKDGP